MKNENYKINKMSQLFFVNDYIVAYYYYNR